MPPHALLPAVPRWIRSLAVLLLALSLLPLAVYRAKAQSGHVHSFGAPDDPPYGGGGISFSQASAHAGEIVDLYVFDYGHDEDLCRNLDGGCSWPGATIWDTGGKVSVQSSGGQAGYLDGLSQFVPSSQFVTHFKVGPHQPGLADNTATVTVVFDDLAQGYDPDTGQLISTNNDPSVTATASIQVVPHEHDWEPVNNLTSISLVVGDLTPDPGERVPILAQHQGTEPDRCLRSGCSFPDGTAMDTVAITMWQSLALFPDGSWQFAGSFGYYDSLSEWVPSGDPALITHWQAPNLPGATVRIECGATDRAQAIDPQTGEMVGTYADGGLGASLDVVIANTGSGSHSHDWAATSNIPAPGVATGSNAPRAGRIITVSASLANDTDLCTAEGCSFFESTAVNGVFVAGWGDDNAGGSFGYMEGSAFTASTDPGLVTHYRCPAAPSPAVTLTVTVDDRFQQITDPGTGSPIDTFDDAPATGTKTIEIRAAGTHEHTWTSTGNTADLPVSLHAAGADVTVTSPREVIELRKGMLAPDHDLCTAGDCSFVDGDATEESDRHRMVRWAEDGGGVFGRLEGGTFTELPAAETASITHYRVGPQLGERHIWMVLDDAASALDPEGERVTTFDDPEKDGTRFAFLVETAPDDEITHRRGDGDDACG